MLGAAPALYGKGILSGPTGTSGLATLKGIVPADESTVTELAAQVEDGQARRAWAPTTAEGLPPILLGRDLANTLAVGVGDVVTVTSPQGRLSPMGILPRVSRYRVAGTVRSGLYEFDASWAYLSLGAAQRLFDSEDRASLVEVRVDDMYAVKDIERVDPPVAWATGFVTQDWIEMNQSLFSALWLEKTAIAITIGLIVMVAALNIVATLILMVMEKHKDIAILVSMGASRGAITRIFMLQGTVIGAVGTLAGGVLGWGACRVLDHYRLIRVPEDVYQVSYVPFRLLPRDAAVVVVAALAHLLPRHAPPGAGRGAARSGRGPALRVTEQPANADRLIVAEGLVKGYRTAAGYVSVLQDVDLEVAAGEMVAITGASGVGKSTLLHVLGTLDRPESGTVTVAGEDVLPDGSASVWAPSATGPSASSSSSITCCRSSRPSRTSRCPS